MILLAAVHKYIHLVTGRPFDPWLKSANPQQTAYTLVPTTYP